MTVVLFLFLDFEKKSHAEFGVKLLSVQSMIEILWLECRYFKSNLQS